MIDIDILIVGGGASGVYCAWRLSKVYPNLKIILTEKCSFLGGRLQSVPFGNKSIYAELGGMRTFQSKDKLLAKVLNQLKIKTIPEPYNEPSNIAFVKDKRFCYEVIDLPYTNTIERKKLIETYHIPTTERNIAIPTLITNAANTIDPNFQTNPASVYKYPNLNHMSFLKFLKENNISDSAINAFRDFSGYDFGTSINTPVSSSVGIREYLSLSSSIQQYFIENGFNSFVFEMAEKALVNSTNMKIKLSMNLKKIKMKNEKFICNFKNEKNITIKIKTNSLILAIPKKNMIKVCAPWTNNALKAFSSLNTWIGFKAFLKIDEKTYNILSHNKTLVGRNVTDLHIRQVWFYSSEPPCLMIYCDEDDAQYWKKYMNKKNKDPCEFPKWHKPNYNVPLVMDLKKQISIIFGICPSTINIKKILYKYWDGGAYFWKPCDIPFLSNKVKKPFGKNAKAYIVGSDYSLYQGWVEGALETAEKVLVENFSLDPITKN